MLGPWEYGDLVSEHDVTIIVLQVYVCVGGGEERKRGGEHRNIQEHTIDKTEARGA